MGVYELIKEGNIKGLINLKNFKRMLNEVGGTYTNYTLTNPPMILLAVALGQEKVVEFLLKCKVDPNSLSVSSKKFQNGVSFFILI